MTNQPRLIGLTGYAQHGKGSVAEILKNEFGYTVLSFADPVRQMALAIDPMITNYDGTYNRLSDLVNRGGWSYAKQNGEVRRLLQRIGTEAAKPIFGKECWQYIGMRKAHEIIANDGRVVFDDVRFPIEEGEAILNVDNDLRFPDLICRINPQIWRVTRLASDGKPYDNGIGTDHPSESQVKNFEPDVEIINNGTLEELEDQVRGALNEKMDCGKRKPR